MTVDHAAGDPQPQPGAADLVLAGRRMPMLDRRPEDMYGSLPGELIGEPVESLVPDGLRSVHISQRAEYAQHPTVRPMAARVRLAGRRKDRSTFPVRVSLSPVLTATGHLILAVVRDVTEDLPTPTWATWPGGAGLACATSERAGRGRNGRRRLRGAPTREGMEAWG